MNERLRRAATAALWALLALAAGRAAAEPAVWSAQGEGATVYLFGSVHVLPPGGFGLRGALAEAWRASARVCFEIEPAKDSVEEIAALTLARAIDPDGRDLFELMGPDADRARALAVTAGIELAPLAAFEPWFAGIMISVAALQEHGYDVAHGVEEILESTAQAEQKPICGLETVDEQLGFLDGLSAPIQREILLQSLAEAADIEAVMGRMLAAWQAGDAAAILRQVEEEFEEYPELADRLLYERNERWAGQVEEMIAAGEDVLLVVGAAHLVGERGLPALLARRGFQVERL